MAGTQRTKRPLTKPERFTFDVTCVVGTVEVGAGDEPPNVVAMKLIAEHDAPGTFSFPMQDGRTQRVTVEFVDDRQFTGRDENLDGPWS